MDASWTPQVERLALQGSPDGLTVGFLTGARAVPSATPSSTLGSSEDYSFAASTLTQALAWQSTPVVPVVPSSTGSLGGVAGSSAAWPLGLGDPSSSSSLAMTGSATGPLCALGVQAIAEPVVTRSAAAAAAAAAAATAAGSTAPSASKATDEYMPDSDSAADEVDSDDDSDEEEENVTRRKRGGTGNKASASRKPTNREEMPPEEKLRSAKERKRWHNRISARAARQRKKMFVQALQEKLVELRDAVRVLQEKRDQLTIQNQGLRDTLGRYVCNEAQANTTARTDDVNDDGDKISKTI